MTKGVGNIENNLLKEYTNLGTGKGVRIKKD
jgi:hypothetical protein